MLPSAKQQSVDSYTPLSELDIQGLERMSDEEFWNYARQRAFTGSMLSSHAEYLECKLSRKTCLIALCDLAEVLPSPRLLARLPHMPVWMAGIMAWREETIAVVCLDRYLWNEQRTDSFSAADSSLLVASQANLTVGLLAPALGFTSTIELEQIAPPGDPAMFTPSSATTIISGL